MSDGPRTYSALSAEERAAVSVWIDSFDQSYEYEGAAALKKAVKAAPEELRPALVSQLLPPLIDHDRKGQGRTPTLQELRSRFPDLTGEITAAYPLLPERYRLPVELKGYRVLRVVGEGGQAIVLRAQDDMHSAVAIKLSASSEHNELLLRERELLAQCQHPGIPEVIASGVDEDRAYFVMPFLRGMTLADKYATHRPTAEEAIRIAGDLCSVVDHLHSHGVLHRDIKPQNVWIDDAGAVKLIDLGMAIDRSSWGQPRAAVQQFHGTPAFMSPEQASADSENDGELSDVFSIGATLYWMGTGMAPYEGASGESVLSKAESGRFDRDRLRMISGWPKGLSNTCLQAMDPNPGKRFHSATAMGAALASGVGGGDHGWPRIAAVTAVLLLGVGAFALRDGAETSWAPLVSLAEPAEEVAGIKEPDRESPTAKEVKKPGQHPAPSEPQEPSDETQGEDPPRENPLPPADDEPSLDDLPAPPEGMEYVPVTVGPYLPHHPDGGRKEWILRSIPAANDRSDAEPKQLSPVKKFEDYAIPYLPDPPDLRPKLSLEQRVKNARAWLASLNPGTKMGHFAGIRFNPTALAPISPALRSIKIPHRTRLERNGEMINGTMTFKTVERFAPTPKWVYQGLTRALTLDDRSEYALDNLVAPVPSPQEWVIRVPPGLQGVSFYGEFLDGSLTERYWVENEDYTLANQVFPVASHKGLAPEACLFLYRAEGVNLRDSLAEYLPKPIGDDVPFRERFERTRVGFYAVPPGWIGTVVTSDKPNAGKFGSVLKPGVVHVTYVNYDREVEGRVAYDVPIERFEELADDAMVYSKRNHNQE